MYCKNCGTQLQDNDVFCTNCGSKAEETAAATGLKQPDQPLQVVPQKPYDQGPARQTPMSPVYPYSPTPPAYTAAAGRQKKTGLVVALAAGGVLLLALIIFLAVRFLGGDKPGKESTATTERTETTTDSTNKKTLGLGEAGVFDGLAIIVDQVTRPNAEFLFSQPADGHEHVLIWYTFENRSKKNVKTPKKTSLYIVSGEDKDSDSGYDMTSYDAESIYTSNEGEYQSGTELAPGEKTSGWLLYQKPIQNPNITIHYYSEFVNRAPDLVYQLPVKLDPIAEPTETSESTTTEQTTTATTAPPVLYDLNELLPGQWATLPDSEHNAIVYSFASDGLSAVAIAYSDSETTLDNWMTEGVWTIGDYYWEGWRIEGDTILFTDFYGDLSFSVTVENENSIVLHSSDTSDSTIFYRMGEEPGLTDYLLGTWIPDVPDEEGVYAALTFMPDGSAVLTGALKKDETAMPSEWGDETYWEILGTWDGSWRIDGESVTINIGGTDDVYTISIDGPYHCVIYYGESWQTPYTRVVYPY